MKTIRASALIGVLLASTLARAVAAGGEALSTPSATQEAVLRELEAWDIEAAQALVKELQKTAPDDAGTLFLAGRVAFELGDYDEAVDLLGKALGPRAENSEDYTLALGAQNEAKNTVVEETAHFTVRYKPGKDAALVPYAMETLESGWSALTKDLGYEPPRKVRIEFYNSPRALARVSSLSEEAIKTTGTIALCKYNRLMVTSPRALVRGYEWQDTITHEFTHFLVTRKSRNTVPIWIHEGIAKYEETRWRGKAGLALDPGGEALLARAVKQDKLITFERMHPSMALLPSQEDAATAFAEVFTAIQFVDEKVGMAGVRAIIDALKAGKSDREAVGGALGTSFEKFESSWKQALRARPAPKVAPGFEKMVFKDDPKKDSKEERKKAYEQGELGTLPNAEARKYAHLGELFRARQRNGPAALEYEKAIALAGPTHPALARKYALVMIDLGRNPEAQKVLEQSLAVFPDEETNHLLLGDLLAKAGRGAEAKTHLLIANQRDPFDADIHELLAQVAKAEKDAGLLAREQDVLKILKGEKLTWRAAQPGAVAALAYLRIEAPAGAKVLVDGVDTGLTTPVQEHPVTSGKHVVRLELPDGKSVEHTVEFAPDEIVPFPQT